MSKKTAQVIEKSDIVIGEDTMLYLEPNMEVVGILERCEDGSYLIERLSRAGRKLGKVYVEEFWFVERIEVKTEDGYGYADYQ